MASEMGLEPLQISTCYKMALQHDPRNRAYMGLEASHFIGEISTGIPIYISIILFIYTTNDGIN
jgi:hypothetical protein